MRDAIFTALFDRMARDPRVFFLTADVGINLVEKIRDTYPDRYLNVGIAEANMVGVAAGLCASGYRPVCYTFSQFLIHRAFEQLRDDVALHGYPLVLLGTTCGFDNCQMGPTHHAVDDWGVARNLPGLEVHCPNNVGCASALFNDVMDDGELTYIRIPKGKGVEDNYRQGAGDTLLMTYGNMAGECFRAHQINLLLSVVVLNTLHPLSYLSAVALRPVKRLVVVEDHFADTGLYSSVCRLVAEQRLPIEVVSRAPCGYYHESGDNPAHFWKKFRGDAESLAEDFG